MRSLMTLVLLAFPIFSFAQTTISDPHNIMEKVNQFIENRSFEEAFQCDSKAVYHYPVDVCDFFCDDSGSFCGTTCQSSPKLATFSLTGCTQDEAYIISDLGYYMAVDKNSFEQAKGNLLPLFIPTLSDLINQPGVLLLLEATETQYTLDYRGPNQRKINAINIKGKYHLSSMPYSPDIIFTIAKDAPGVAQILRFRIDTTTWFRMKDF